MRLIAIRKFVGAMTLSLGVFGLSFGVQAAPPELPPGLEKKLFDVAKAKGQVRIIVGLQLQGQGFRPEGKLPSQAAVGQQRAAIAKANQALKQELLPYQAGVNREYVTLPYVALSVNANALEHIMNSPRIISIEEDKISDAALASAGPFIGADLTWDADFGGQGTAVAILDTGIDANHPFFEGAGPTGDVNRVVDEACFSTNSAATTLCPDGSDEQYGIGSADAVNVNNCSLNGDGTGGNLCTHGTHVAGIAAGQDAGTGYDGTAPETGIVAVQVFHRNPDCKSDVPGSQPCVQTNDSDIIAGLDWIQWWSGPRHKVVSANLSIQGGYYYEPCVADATQAAIASLRSTGIATAAAAGNAGWTWAISYPGCAPDAVTVGAVYDGFTTGTEGPYDVLFNLSEYVDIMAVGSWFDSSIPDDAYDNKSGTSMAAPQVTGAFAVLKSIAPSLSIDAVEQLLKNTGVLVIDQREPFPVDGDDDYPDPCDPPGCQPYSRIQKPLLQLEAAVAAVTTANMGVTKDCKPDGDKLVGEEALCFITVTNHGPDAAMDVQVIDTYISDGSSDFTFGTVEVDPPSAGTCTADANPQNPSGAVTCDLGGTLDGEVVKIMIPVTSDDPLNVDDEVTVTALTPDSDISNNLASDGITFVDGSANLRVLKNCLPNGNLPIGETATCTIWVENLGPSDAQDVVMTDALVSEGHFQYLGSSSSGFDSCTPGSLTTSTADVSGTSGEVTCVQDLLVAGLTATATVTITTVDSQPVDVDDTATVTSSTPDPDGSNNDASDGVTFVVPVVDIVVSKVCKPDTPYVIGSGDPTAYCDITVQNLGQEIATNVILTDEIISLKSHRVTGITMVSGYAPADCSTIPPSGPTTETTVTCVKASPGLSLAPNAVAKVRVEFRSIFPVEVNDTASATTTANDTNPDNNGKNNPAARDTVAFIENADVSVSKVCTPPESQAPGVSAFCTITVVNNGPSRANAVTLQDKLLSTAPNPGFVVVDVQEHTTQGSFLMNCPQDTMYEVLVPEYDINCAVDTGNDWMEAGDQFEIQVEVVASDPIVIRDVATVSSTTPDSALGNNTAEGQVSFGANADLGITKEAAPHPDVVAGTQLTYTLFVTNHGPSEAVNVVVSDTLPTGVSLNSVWSSGGSCTAVPLACTFNTLEESVSEGMTVVVDVLPSTTGVLINSASVSSDTPDLNNLNDDDHVETNVTPSADVGVVKTMTSDAVVAGALVHYTVTVTNHGPSTATGVTLIDILDGDQDGLGPDEGGFVTYVSAVDSSNIDVCDESGGTLTCDLGTLQPGESFDVFLTGLVDPSAVGEIIDNDASVSANEDDPNPANDSVHVGEEAVEGADLWMEKVSNFPAGNPSGTIIYDLIVHNDEGCNALDGLNCGTGGPSDASGNIQVIDALPGTPKNFIVQFWSPDCEYFEDSLPGEYQGDLSDASHYIQCDIPVLPVGEIVKFQVHADAKGNLKGDIINEACIIDEYTDTADPDHTNNCHQVKIVQGGGTGDRGGPGGGRGRGKNK